MANAREIRLTTRARLLALLRLEKQSLYLILVYAVLVGVVSLAAPMGVQALVGAIAFGGLKQPLLILALLVFLALILAGVLRALHWWVAEKIQQRVFVRTALDVSRKLPHLRVSVLDSRPTEIINHFFDVMTIQKGASTLLVDGVYVALQLIVGSFLLALYHPFLLAFAVGLILVIAFILIPLGLHGPATAVKESKAKYAVVSWFEEMARHATAFRSREGVAFATARGELLTKTYLDARREHFRVVFRQGLAFFALQAIATAALLGIGGLLVLEGQITLGQLVAAELIVAVLIGAFSKFGKYLESYYDLLAAAEKVGELIDVPIEASSGTYARSTLGLCQTLLKLSTVSFVGHHGRDILKDLSFEINRGEHVSIYGPNGTGKSTLLELIWGLEEPHQGTIEFEGVPLKHMDQTELRSAIALVRDEGLFDGTIEENIRVGRDHLDIQEVRSALESVDLWETVASSPQGLKSNATRAGFSRGQVCRLLIARAIVSKPVLLLIDDVLDGMDADSRTIVAQCVFSSSAPWSVILTTHDQDVARMLPKQYELREGAL